MAKRIVNGCQYSAAAKKFCENDSLLSHLHPLPTSTPPYHKHLLPLIQCPHSSIMTFNFSPILDAFRSAALFAACTFLSLDLHCTDIGNLHDCYVMFCSQDLKLDLYFIALSVDR